MGADEQTTWRAVKVWEGEEPFLVWQVGTRDGPAKFYLRVDATLGRPAVLADLAKPDGLKAQGAFCNIVRKYARSGGLGPVMEDAEGAIWIPLYTTRGEEFDYMVGRLPQSPPELVFVDRAGTILARKSARGTYTKRRSWDGSWPPVLENARNLSPSLLSQLNDSEEQEEAVHEPKERGLLPEYQREARDRLARRLKTVRKALSKIASEIPSEEELTRLEESARQLQAHLYLVKPEMIALELPPERTGLEETLKIELDPEVSPGANLERLFIKLKKGRKAAALGEKRLATARENVATMEADLERLRKEPLRADEVNQILARHGLARPEQGRVSRKEQAFSLPYREIMTEQGVRILIGKSAKDNDELVKQAKSNDTWLHVVGVSGSHVILPARELKGPPSPTLLRRAAILALHFSKLREAHAGEVYVSVRGELKKKKGMPPGLWNVGKAETLFVRYDEDELRQALGGAATGNS